MKNRFGIDWLTMTIHAPSSVAVAFMQELDIFHQMKDLGHGGRGYKIISKHPTEFKFYQSPQDDRQEHFCLEFPSTSLYSIGFEKIMKFVIHALKNYRVNITRLDLAFDTQQVDTNMVWAWLSEDRFKSRVKRDGINRHYSLDGSGDTIYVGARTSECMLRVYKKTVENDEIFKDEYFTRFELELKDNRATYIMHNLAFLPMQATDDKRGWVDYYFEIMNGFILFEADEWLELVQTSKKSWFRVLKRKSNVRRTGAWLSKQVYRSLAMYLEYVGNKNAINQYGDFVEVMKEDAIEQTLSIIYQRGKRDMSDWQKKVAASGMTPQNHDSIHISETDVLYDGRDYNAVISGWLDFVGSPLRDRVAEMSEWQKKHIFYLQQLELPGIDMAALLKNPAISHYSL